MHRRTAVTLAVALVGLLAYATAWATASPVGSSPDEAAHVVYAWGVATGQTLPGNERLEAGQEAGDSTLTLVDIPRALFQVQDCYAKRPASPASCPELSTEGTLHAATYHTRYPPPYYVLQGSLMRAGLALGLDGGAILLGLRVLAGAACLLMVGAAAVVLGRRFGPPLAVLCVLAGLTPGGISLFSAINPNGVEIAAAILVAALVVAVRHDASRPGGVSTGLRWSLAGAFVLLTWARPLSPVWAGLLLLVLVWPRGAPRTWLDQVRRGPGLAPVVVVLANLVLAFAWMVYEFSARNVDVGGSGSWGELPFQLRVALVVLKFGDLVVQMVGSMGWDVVLPSFFTYAWVLAVAALFWIGAGWGRRRVSLRVPLGYLLATMVVVAGYSLLTGFGWQGRYWLSPVAAFLVLCLPAIAGRDAPSAPEPEPAGYGPRHLGVLVTFVALQLGGLVWFMWRHVYGVQPWQLRFDAMPFPVVPPGWSPIGGQKLPLALAAVALIALVLVLTRWRSSAVAADELADETRA